MALKKGKRRICTAERRKTNLHRQSLTRKTCTPRTKRIGFALGGYGAVLLAAMVVVLAIVVWQLQWHVLSFFFVTPWIDPQTDRQIDLPGEYLKIEISKDILHQLARGRHQNLPNSVQHWAIVPKNDCDCEQTLALPERPARWGGTFTKNVKKWEGKIWKKKGWKKNEKSEQKKVRKKEGENCEKKCDRKGAREDTTTDSSKMNEWITIFMMGPNITFIPLSLNSDPIIFPLV